MRVRKAALGEEHPLYASDLGNLAGLLAYQDRKAEAKKYGIEAHRIALATLGKDHPDTKTFASWRTFK